jgi:NADH:ubiquinone oxidoreductase subunit 4 (subunit M)
MNGISPGTHLLLVIATPLVGAVVAWLLGSRGRHAVRQSAAVTALITLVGTGWLLLR